MKKLISILVSSSVCCAVIPNIFGMANTLEKGSLIANQAQVRQAVGAIGIKGTDAQARMKSRARSRALGAAERRERLLKRQQERQEELARRQAFALQKKEKEASLQLNDPKNLSHQKPAAPQNTMLQANVSSTKSVVIKSPLTQLKKS